MEYLFFGGNPNFISNDSYQYLSIAYDIYLDKKATGLINYALNLYYDEIALFGYDFNNLKPYHFPSYSAFLSLFYYIYENHNFVVYSSQYISFLLFSMSSFLIIDQYCRDKKISLAIILSSIFLTPIIQYISDSGKEIFCSALAMLAIYLSLYSPSNFIKKQNHNNKFWREYCQKYLKILILSVIFTFLVVTRNFYLALSILILIYYFLPNKYQEDYDENCNKYDLKDKLILSFFIFVIPLCAYIYCYYFIEIHLFIFDNRTDFYGGKNLQDLALRVFTNLLLTILFFIKYFELPRLLIADYKISFSTLSEIFTISLIGLIFYFNRHLKKYYSQRIFKISKIFIINSFFLAIIISVILRFNIMGYRLTIGYLPIVFLFFYINFFKDANKNVKTFFIIYLAINLIINLIVFANSKKNTNNLTKYNNEVVAITKKYQAKNIVTFSNPAPMPLFYKFPREVNFLSAWRHEDICDDLHNYHIHNIDFDLIFYFKRDQDNKILKERCHFIEQNFTKLNEGNINNIYINKRILSSLQIVK